MAKVYGHSMIGVGIEDDDLVTANRAFNLWHGRAVVVMIAN